ncbi:hypothetical protein EYB59_07860 [Acinetobacter bereziniae]|uniref:hypothetical protein n=1 Tax=Acinetobacter bereziniae TaxID=106648 RepID=UPI00111AFCA7|nr:hypothetical protein [Acinetobacter bereziniae]TNL51265.1 hypothetical protein EYB59_07860 [Acinetobacter bereziniae]
MRNLSHIISNLTVSKLLLSEIDNSQIFKLKSMLRLNTINLMNDPEEGLLINKLLCLNNQIMTKDLAFIACFTLHHDSLNQFRLYAKEGFKEASGLSLVLHKDFFSKEHNVARIYEKQKISKSISKDSDNSERDNDNGEINTEGKKMLASMPLYRCIYFDPTSGLIKVAQREEWSFRREFKLEGDHNWFDINTDTDNIWKEYSSDIDKIEYDVKRGLEELSKLVNKLRINKLNSHEYELLAEILLPLRYLMKHMAFKEEQECRIVYVTQMDNSLIQYDDNINRIYINYEPSVMEYLDKIYIAPKAKEEKWYSSFYVHVDKSYARVKNM